MPRLLDLFSGAGGAAMGYSRAGFDEIVGIDIVPQKNYPFTFIQGDALNPPVRLEEFDLIHASPPCQEFTTLKAVTGKTYPDLVAATRRLVDGHQYVIENVPGAPLVNPIVLCGSSFGLQVRRHRLFELSWAAWSLPCRHSEQGQPLGVYGNGGGGLMTRGRKATRSEAKDAMGIGWMRHVEISQAIPPAYTEYLGRQFLDQLARL